MSRLIQNAQLKIFDNASHFALWQDPASFNQVMVEFLSSMGSSTSTTAAASSAR